ncbi:MAG TPA: hypothetical protein VFQ21_02190, partial [Gemmatimonadota bacterium]|nr:hypothetical protein [Gemmatimonadota bacterium]
LPALPPVEIPPKPERSGDEPPGEGSTPGEVDVDLGTVPVAERGNGRRAVGEPARPSREPAARAEDGAPGEA